MSKTDLFGEFSEVSSKAWKQKIQFDLKGVDYNETLLWESPEGIAVKPFYHADDLKDQPLCETDSVRKWHIGQTIFAVNEQKANKKALDVLNRGAESMVFTIPSSTIIMEKLLAGIDLQTVPIYFDFQFLSAEYIKSMLTSIDKSRSDIYLNIDIIGQLASSGNWFFNLKEDHSLLKAILAQSKGINTLGVDVSLYQNAGANIVQQLAYGLAHANEYLNLVHNDTETLKHVGSLTFKVSIGANYFFEIAKLRALKLLWNALATEYGIKLDCHIMAIPSKRNKTLYDYNTNMLRTTTECMSAILGGADTICNLPYDAMYHKDNEFGERIARNQLLILKEESYFNRVSNPADGAYYIEILTRQLAEKALALFKSIELGGGFLKQLKAHTIQRKIKESAQKEQEAFNAKKEILVGTNKYQNTADKMKDDLELHPFVDTKPRKTLIEPIIEKRLAEELEQKRLKEEEEG